MIKASCLASALGCAITNPWHLKKAGKTRVGSWLRWCQFVTSNQQNVVYIGENKSAIETVKSLQNSATSLHKATLWFFNLSPRITLISTWAYLKSIKRCIAFFHWSFMDTTDALQVTGVGRKCQICRSRRRTMAKVQGFLGNVVFFSHPFEKYGKSDWIMKPQFCGMKIFKKSKSKHHLVKLPHFR